MRSRPQPAAAPRAALPALAVAVGACVAAVAAGGFASTAAQEAPPPAATHRLQFTLASEGLPTDGRWKSTPAIEDINKDGRADLISQVRLEDVPHVWLQDDKGAWVPAMTGLQLADRSCGGGVDVRDINGDGHFDLAVADHCKGVWVFLGNGKGEWTTAAEALNPASSKRAELADSTENPFLGAEDLAVGDVTGDKKLDIVSCASDRGGFTLYAGDGTGKGWKETPDSGLPTADAPGEGHMDEGGWCREVLLQDMNGDTHLDVVATYQRGPRVWLGDGRGKFRAASEGLPVPLLNGIVHQVFVGDVNADGRPDLAVANQVNGPEVFLQNADGSWKPMGDLMPTMFGGAYSIALGDLDADGTIDLVTGGRLQKNGRFGIYALRGDGQGHFSPFTSNLPDGSLEVVWGLTIADINRDRRPDVVATIGGVIGQASSAERKAEKGKIPHVQVWLNEPK